MFVFQVSINTKSIGLVVSNRFQLVRFFYALPRKKKQLFSTSTKFLGCSTTFFPPETCDFWAARHIHNDGACSHITKEIYGFPKDARKVTFALEVSVESSVTHGE